MIGFPKALPLVVAAAVTAVPGSSSAAQAACGERQQIIAELERKYGETRRSIGLQ